MGRYVPPALRKKPEAAAGSETPQPDQPSSPPAMADDGTPRSLATLAITEDKTEPDAKTRYTLDEIHNHYRPPAAVDDPSNNFEPCPPSSLNNSLDHPNELAYLMLFPNANPKWDSRRTVFAKSNLELLPGLEGLVTRGWARDEGPKKYPGGREVEQSEHTSKTDQASAAEEQSGGDEQAPAAASHPAPTEFVHPLVDYTSDDEDVSTTPSSEENKPEVLSTRLIPVFQQLHRGHRTIEFIGYYNIQKITYLRPRSRALINMLEVKFGGDPAKSMPEQPQQENAKPVEDAAELTASTNEDAMTKPSTGSEHESASPNTSGNPPNNPPSRQSKYGESKGPTRRSGEAWNHSLSIPWAVIKMRLVALPTPTTPVDPARGKESAFWQSDKDNTMDPPVIETHPELDGEYFKQSRDAFKQRRQWRSDRGEARGQSYGRGRANARGWGAPRGRGVRGRGGPGPGGRNPSDFSQAIDVRLEEGTAELASLPYAQTDAPVRDAGTKQDRGGVGLGVKYVHDREPSGERINEENAQGPGFSPAFKREKVNMNACARKTDDFDKEQMKYEPMKGPKTDAEDYHEEGYHE
ncbi:MAG: hypothetical protein Q9162_003168 [Coniocarpon cinnabarinum]